ncbi:MAG TPA: type II toxin-antitoxin system VapC family toxin [Rhodanobacteraceae bacterium]|nr:type II toxin-antitoxin system VapC family toxin [Rhodanobacteraceae bacterium]
MIGLDTNVLVRYIVRDDAHQAAAATRFLEGTLGAQHPGFIDNIVLCELFWVLESGYGYTRADITATLQRLLEVDRFRFEAPELAWQALDACRNGADFADALLARINEVAGCDYTATFDQRAATRIEPMRLLTR